jgi:hypothetical protein
MAVMLVVGIGATTFASTHLEGVVRTVEHNFGRSFWTGVASQLAVLPVLGLTIAALALSVVGAVAIPVAIVVFLVALAGVATLGFLATAQLTGGAFLSTTARSSLSARDAARRGLVLGVLFYTGLWVAAAAFSGFPLGATVWSRAGTRVPATVVTPDLPLDDYEWSTPTPIAGVAAARRSAPTPQYTERT